MTASEAGPCPNCGGIGSVPDGVYDFLGETLTIASTWPADRLQRFATALEEAGREGDREAAEAAIAAEGHDLLEVAKRLAIPRDAGQFWAFVVMLIALLTLIRSCGGDPSRQPTASAAIQNATGVCAAPGTKFARSP